MYLSLEQTEELLAFLRSNSETIWKMYKDDKRNYDAGLELFAKLIYEDILEDASKTNKAYET